jgi:serine/threonine protein phosphatase PrpC
MMTRKCKLHIDSLLLKGLMHEVYGEDALFAKQLDDNWFIGAVMDGCSSGKDSYFASALLSKMVEKGCKTLPYLGKVSPDFKMENMSPKAVGEFLLNQVFDDLKQIRKKLLIDDIELLSTLLLAVVNIPDKQAYVNVSGDGYICCNGDITTIDQHNIPDYMTYHLNQSFDNWLHNHTRIFEIKKIETLTLSSDGISKYLNMDMKRPPDQNTISYLLKTLKLPLKERHKHLTHTLRLAPYDDVSILELGME